jgi:hypothetical protein
MSGFSASDAALEGFQVLRRHWRVVAGWAGFNLLAMIAMVVVTVIVALVAAALMGGGSNASQISATLGGIIALVGTLVVEVIMMAGLYRLMLRPEEPAFLHLRLGKAEFRVLAALLIYLVGALAVTLLARLAVQAVHPAGLWISIVVGVAAFAVAVWLGLRLALTLPAAFDAGPLGFGTSWRLTRGRVAGLLGMVMLAVCVLLLIAFVYSLVLFVVLGFTTGFRGLMGAMTGGDIQSAPGIYITQIAAQLVFAPVLGVIGQAPFVAAYKAFSNPAAIEPVAA